MENTEEQIKSLTKLRNTLLKEKSFWALLGVTLKIKSNTGNILIPTIVFILFLLFNLFNVLGAEKITATQVAISAKDLVGWYYTILGFLIAGYTIFASVTDIKNSIRMAKINDTNSGLPFLKYVHAVFFKTLIVFFIGSCLSLLTVFFVRSYGFIGFILKNFNNFSFYILAFLDALNIAMFVLAAMMLKSFLYNIYTSVMITVALGVQAEIEEIKNNQKDNT